MSFRFSGIGLLRFCGGDGGELPVHIPEHRAAYGYRERRREHVGDGLRELHAEHPDADLFFITGADALQNILTWKDTEEIFQLAHFVGVTRPGHELDTSGLPDDGVTLIEVPAMAISSTDCRTRVAAGAPVWYLVPDGVVQYINKYALYTGGDGR